MVNDAVQDRVLDIIASKKKGRAVKTAKAEPETPSNVIYIMDALRKSISFEGESGNRIMARSSP
jgi:DNA end-binding protein Ku